ncbi:MAG TPA: hypothetical protein VKX49_16555 [Bryobacteraceae bacterium]|nr:hypothetical protein [Bryobacteraceae bacterium]
MFSVLTDFDKLSVDRFKKATQAKLRDVRCPDHHRPPRLRFNGSSLQQISISLSGCCTKLMEIANARIAAPQAPSASAASASSNAQRA